MFKFHVICASSFVDLVSIPELDILELIISVFISVKRIVICFSNITFHIPTPSLHTVMENRGRFESELDIYLLTIVAARALHENP